MPHFVGIDIITRFAHLAPADAREFKRVRNNGSEFFGNLFEAFEQNSFQPPNGPRRAVYLLNSRFNHSCIPNARSPLEDRDVSRELVAAKDISIGQEITFSYSPSDFSAMTCRERQQCLPFECNCKACLEGTPYQKLSDMRRRLIRGLQYLMRGVDLDKKRDASASPLICDPELKDMAEIDDLPMSCEFVILLLYICLFEAEGVLDDGDVEAQEKDLRNMVSTFQNRKNCRVAKRAMEQPTWSGRFWVALGVWKEVDRADFFIAMMRSMPGYQR